jgi:hypothetical protein
MMADSGEVLTLWEKMMKKINERESFEKNPNTYDMRGANDGWKLM